MDNTKKCPYCGEEIMADATKCKHCGEWLNDEAEPKQETRQENAGKELESLPKNEVLAESQPVVAAPLTESALEKSKESLFKSCFWEQMTKHYYDFKGNVDRKTFWICYLYWVLLMWVIGGVSVVLPLVGNVLMWIASLGLTLPFLGLSVRRLHDIGKKGTWIFIALVPLVGPIWFLVLMAQKGEAQNPNKWNVKDTIIAIAMLVVSVVLFAVGIFATDSETSDEKELLFKDVKNSETAEIEKQVLDAYNNGTIYGLMTPEFKAADEAAGKAETMFGEIFHDADIFYNTQDELPDVVGVKVELTEEYEAVATVMLRFYGDWGSRWDSTVLVMVRDNQSANSKNARWLVDDVISSYVNDRGEVVYYSQKAAMMEFFDEAYGARAYIPNGSEGGFSYEVDGQGNEWQLFEDGTAVYRGNVNDDEGKEDDVELEDVGIEVETNQNEVVEELVDSEIEEDVEQEVFQIAEEMPQFPDGEQAMWQYIAKNIKYPQVAREADIQGRVLIGFVVEPDGSISNVKLLRGIGGGCDEEAMRVVKSMPKWKPGRQRGKTVRVAYQIPVNFKLQSHE